MDVDREWSKEFIKELERLTDSVSHMDGGANNTVCAVTVYNRPFIFWMFVDEIIENEMIASICVHKRANGGWEEFVELSHQMTLSPDEKGAIKAFKFILSMSG